MEKLKQTVLLAAGLLGGFSLIGMGLVALTHYATEERIVENEREALLQRLQVLVPEATYDNEILQDTTLLAADPLLGNQEPVIAYRARSHGEPVAVVFTVVAPQGYSGAIKLLVAVENDGSLAGVRVISHKETPGLGDAIEEDRTPWIESFDGRSLTDPEADDWAVKRDGGIFDQFTGATITPRAVVKAVHSALLYFDAHKSQLFAETTASQQNIQESQQ